MNGYIQNNGTTSKFTAQRGFHPGARVEFDKLLLTLSKNSGFNKVGMGFIKWLKSNTFSEDRWGFYNSDGSDFKFTKSNSKSVSQEAPEAVSEDIIPAKGAGQKFSRSPDAPANKNTITPTSIIEADFDVAKSQIEKCRDRVVLKKALNLSRHFSNKEQHMRYLMRRIDQIY